MQLDTGIQGTALVAANPGGLGVAAIARQTGSVVGIVRNSIGNFTLTTDPLSLLDYAPVAQAIVDYTGDVAVKVRQITETTWEINTSADGAPADIDFFLVIVRYPSSSGAFVASAAPGAASVANGSLWARHVFGTGALGDLVQAANNFAFLGGDFNNFTLDAGFTISPPANRGIIIRARQSIVINGTIDCSGVNSNADIQAQDLFFGSQVHSAGGGGGASGDAVAGAAGVAVPAIYQNLGFLGSINATPGIAGVGAGGVGGNAAGGTLGSEAIGLVRFWTDNGVPLPYNLGGLPGGIGGTGGAGADAAVGGVGGLGGEGGAGGAGGSYIALIAPSITFGAAAIVRANGVVGVDGLNGGAGANGAGAGDNGGGGGGGGGGGQGGTGGYVYILYVTKTDAGATIEALGGPASANGLGGAGGVAGAGGVDGGDGGNASSFVIGGNIGRDGYVIDRQLTPMP